MRKVKNNIVRSLQIPLMAVMLLWALTLPGQEVEVYNLLLHSPTSKAAIDLIPASKGQLAVQRQGVHAFQDAKVSSFVILDWQQWIKQPLLLLIAFATPTDELLPSSLSSSAAIRLSTQLLAIILQPNAP